MKRTIFFDLDGTLLPMDQNAFLKAYLHLIGKTMAAYGYEPGKLVNVILSGTNKMINNDGDLTNEEVFWEEFTAVYGKAARHDEPLFHKFYVEMFPKLQQYCGFNPLVPPLIKKLKALGYTLVLATNPVFPAVATHERIRWAGLEVSDFTYITTYDNSHSTKPNPRYFQELLTKLGVKASDVLMVGNDTNDDLAAAKVGIELFFITDTLINGNMIDLSRYPHGTFPDLATFLQIT